VPTRLCNAWPSRQIVSRIDRAGHGTLPVPA
jgi:hypothetical protein